MKTSLFTLLIIICSSTAGWGDELPRTISVSGQGRASGQPDMAMIQSGVTSSAKTAQEALSANNEAMEKIFATLASLGIDKKDMQTSGFRVYPEYRQTSGRGRTNEISGYRVNNSLSVKICDLKELGKILDALVRSGSNQISGVSFFISERDEITNSARKAAVRDARGRAELYALATGVQVGKVISISEQSSTHSPQPMYARGAMAEMASSVPIATGEQEITSTVNIVYELVD